MTIPSADKVTEQLSSLWIGVHNGIVTLENTLAISCKGKTYLPYNPVILTPSYLSARNKNICKKTLMQIFIVALFIIAPN